jgi:hypothetical protein
MGSLAWLNRGIHGGSGLSGPPRGLGSGVKNLSGPSNFLFVWHSFQLSLKQESFPVPVGHERGCFLILSSSLLLLAQKRALSPLPPILMDFHHHVLFCWLVSPLPKMWHHLTLLTSTWRWRQKVSPKSLYPPIGLRVSVTKKTSTPLYLNFIEFFGIPSFLWRTL